MTLTPLPAGTALDAHFLEARSKLLDLAAILDRIDRGSGSSTVAEDLRIARIRQALDVLAEAGANRAEKVQMIFSLPYDSQWNRPTPKS